MNRKLLVLVAVLALVAAVGFAQDLKIEYQLVLSGAPGSYLTFTGPIRYMAVDKDHVDATGSASMQKSTEIFQPYRYDVKGKNVLPDGLRGLFLYAVGPLDERKADNLIITRANDGVITVRFAHRGTAYELVTDRSGRFTFPNGNYRKRAIGYIQGEGPQVISRDFSSNGTAERIDWDKVWSDRVAGGKEITKGVPNKTGNIVVDNASPESMFYWDGALQLTLENNVLKITGGMNAVKR